MDVNKGRIDTNLDCDYLSQKVNYLLDFMAVLKIKTEVINVT